MNNSISVSDRLARAFQTPAGGVLGLVHELIEVSTEQEIRITWQAGRCQVAFPSAQPQQQIDVLAEKSVFRAVIARVAALCNERVPGSVSPYRGIGEIASDPTHVVRAKFVNTAEEQSLELSGTRTNATRQTETKSLVVVDQDVASSKETSATV